MYQSVYMARVSDPHAGLLLKDLDMAGIHNLYIYRIMNIDLYLYRYMHLYAYVCIKVYTWHVLVIPMLACC
jgi:hypothetical protein